MKAKIEPRINLHGRTPLQDVIPLDTPFILFVDPSSICNFKCKFCPSGHPELIKNTKRKQTLMDFNLYKKIIDNIEEFNQSLKVLRLYKEGEPLLNKNFANMVKYAKDNQNIKYIDTTTNGYLLKLEIIKPILEAGLDRINISVDGLSDKQFLELTGVKVDFNKYSQNIINLYKLKEKNFPDFEICIKITGDFLTEQEKENFYNLFGNYCDRIFIENVAPCWTEFNVEKYLNTKISNKGIYDNHLTNIDVCPYIFYSTTINSDGTASLCFLDWAHKLIIGDAKKQSLKEIWNSKQLFQYQIKHLSGQRKQMGVCKDCGQLTHCLPDDIDPYREQISKRLLEKRNTKI